MFKIYTKDGRYFKLREYNKDEQKGIGFNGKPIYFYNDSIIAIEYDDTTNV